MATKRRAVSQIRRVGVNERCVYEVLTVIRLLETLPYKGNIHYPDVRKVTIDENGAGSN
jgi:hypothetical protein